LFVYYKVQSKKNKKLKNESSSSQDSWFSSFSLVVFNYSWMTWFNCSDFELSIDVDTAKVFIFMNTVFMTNISISKKLSHNDSYINFKSGENFKFDIDQIFARKPLKKIKRNVISKFTKLFVMKGLMHLEMINLDDLIFVFILGFHQLCFLYYAQMNKDDNYLKLLTSRGMFARCLTFFKKYSKGNSLLVKVNKKFLSKTMTSVFRLTVIWFLFRMQIAQGIKDFISKAVIEKEHKIPGIQDIKQLQIDYFWRVSAPTIVLYIMVVLMNSHVCTLSDFQALRQVQIAITSIFECGFLIHFAEWSYLLIFVYNDYIVKDKKAELKKLLKQKKGNKKNEESNDRFHSGSEVKLLKRKDSDSNCLSEEEPNRMLNIPIIKKQLQRGLKSHLALSAAKNNIKCAKHFPQLLKENILQNFFQNKSQNLQQFRRAKSTNVEEKLKTYIQSSSLYVIEEELSNKSD
jgi:hypothetical protein